MDTDPAFCRWEHCLKLIQYLQMEEKKYAALFWNPT